MLEAGLRTDNAFVTLTYSDDNVPREYVDRRTGEIYRCDGKYTLYPSHLQLWLKRIRKAWMLPLRYYAVGEYGDVSERPHYHAIIFGLPMCRYGRSRYSYRRNCCDICDLVRDTWRLGNVDVGEANMASAGYLSGYVTKKLSRGDIRLCGRYPEFARMSLRPGIGADMMDEVASAVLGLGVEQADVPSALRHGSRLMPLGRYLTRRLRARVGRAPEAPQSKLDEVEARMQPLRQAAFDASRPYKEVIREVFDGAAASLEARQRIYRKRGDL